MPYFENGIRYTRITELTSYIECEALAHIDKTKPINRPVKGNVVTLPGTLCHHKIAEHEMDKMSVPYKKIEMEFNAQEKFLFQEILMDHKEQKEIQKLNPSRFGDMPPDQLRTKYEIMLKDIDSFYDNYLVFDRDNPHVPVYIEEKRFYDPLQIAGTVDLIAKFNLIGRVEKLDLHPYFSGFNNIVHHSDPRSGEEWDEEMFVPNVGEKEYFVPDPDGEKIEVTTLLDWKSSKAKQKGHPLQLSAYHLKWELLGDMDKMRNNGHIINSQCYSVLLGNRKKIPKYVLKQGLPTEYQFFQYEVDSTAFLECLEIRKSPRPIAMDIDGNVGIKGRCVFCGQLAYCPDNKIIPSVRNVQSLIPLTEFDLRDTTALTLLMSEMDNPSINNVKKKIGLIHQQLENRQKAFNKTDILSVVLHDIGKLESG